MNMFTGLKGEGMAFPTYGTVGQTKHTTDIDMNESDPNGRNPHEPGAKLDAGKSPLFRGLLDYFPRACNAVADISAFGASKYAWKGWESVPDGINRYSDAELRHFTKEAVEGAYDRDSGHLHKAHRAWNALAALELYLRQNEPK